MSSRSAMALLFVLLSIGPLALADDDNPLGVGEHEAAPSARVAREVVQVDNTSVRTGEKVIKTALANDRTTLEFVEIPLSDVVNYIRERHHLEIAFDGPALKDAAIDSTALPVSINIHDLPLRSALHLILSQFQLTSIIQDDVLIITTHDKANATLTMKIYDVNDLAPRTSEAENAVALQQLTDILCSIPAWHSAGDGGSIKPFNHAGISALAVTHNAEAHEQIEKTLGELRKLKPQKSQ